MSNNNIDFVITWVDPSDPDWIKQREVYKPRKVTDSNSEARFRDMDTLRYAIRGIDCNAPWFRYLHFVTAGHLPEWLDVTHPKLKIHKHSDFFEDKSDLPTFNANSIDLNLVLLPNLSETFVYFNDDTIITKPVESSRFFQNGKPVDFLVQNILKGLLVEKMFPNNSWVSSISLTIETLNKNYKKRESQKKYRRSYFSKSYTVLDNFKNLLAYPFKRYSFIEHYHHPQPHTRSTWKQAINSVSYIVKQTRTNKFRTATDLSVYYFRYINLVTGNFIPNNNNDHKVLQVSSIKSVDNINTVLRKHTFVCINDVPELDHNDFEAVNKIVTKALNKVLPNKSSFEKK